MPASVVGVYANILMPSVAVPIVTDGGSDDVAVVRDRRRDFGSHIVKVRVLRIPASDRFPDGVKYAFHYGRGAATIPSSGTTTTTASTNATRAARSRRSTSPGTNACCGGSSGSCRPTTLRTST